MNDSVLPVPVGEFNIYIDASLYSKSLLSTFNLSKSYYYLNILYNS